MKTFPKESRLLIFFTFVLVVGAALHRPVLASDIPIDSNVVVKFADAATGCRLLTNRDDFIAAMTPLDRRARLDKTEEVSEAELLAFIGENVREWKSAESNRVAGALIAVAEKLAPARLPFPKTILLIRTSGKEEFNNLYTRQNAIVIPPGELGAPLPALQALLLHELFHVLSRHDAELRRAAYGVIGFRPVNEITLPDDLLRRKVTNPDGVLNGWIINLTNRLDHQPVATVPILLATSDHFNPNERGANPYDYFRLLAVHQDHTHWVPQLVDGAAVLLKPADTQGWSEQIGRNTGYIIHPDEILAENFVQLITGKTNVPSPAIIRGLAEVFRQRSAKINQ